MVETTAYINRIGILSLGKIVGLIYALFGLIVGGLMALFSVLGGVAMQGFMSYSAMNMFFGIGSIIIFPIFYGIMGFIVGILVAWFYNIISGWVGGLKIEVRT
ncbi:hypothetical protein [Methanolobus halotolerans]|uniref:DUF3566 domain-containing protein n=1 Tax=Methanolobus halotolerans TaxID=2052935 RepID=A0A4E0PZ33_9EURY|nr:hypothetical protein [Methanolobus halotolerans]TGC10922.1 hypothetical protein CUN85_01850 [Methanolobus halotolerans]